MVQVGGIIDDGEDRSSAGYGRGSIGDVRGGISGLHSS